MKKILTYTIIISFLLFSVSCSPYKRIRKEIAKIENNSKAYYFKVIEKDTLYEKNNVPSLQDNASLRKAISRSGVSYSRRGNNSNIINRGFASTKNDIIGLRNDIKNEREKELKKLKQIENNLNYSSRKLDRINRKIENSYGKIKGLYDNMQNIVRPVEYYNKEIKNLTTKIEVLQKQLEKINNQKQYSIVLKGMEVIYNIISNGITETNSKTIKIGFTIDDKTKTITMKFKKQ